MIVEKNKSGLSFHMIRNVAQTEYIKWICNPRILIFMILYVFLYDYIIQEMLKAAHKMGEMLMVFEPFIAMTNSSLLIMVIPAVFIVLVSDFPKTDGNTMFYISRVGKNNWMFGQLLFGIMAAGSYLMSILVISVTLVVRHSFGENMWSNVITSYTKAFPNEKMARIPMLVNGKLYNNMTPVQTVILTITLLMLYLMVMELMLLVSFSVGKRMMGILISYTIIGVGSALCGLKSKIQWVFPSAHSIAWLHFDDVLRIQKFKISYSYIYFIVLLIVLFAVSLVTVKRYDFAKITDMED